MSDLPRRLLRSLGCGLAMGSADAVPGVSGGTIALVLGIYDRLLDSLAALLALLTSPQQAATRRQALATAPFILPLGGGILLAYYLATLLLVGSYALPEAVLAAGEQAIRAYLVEHPPEGLLLNPLTAPVVFAFFFGLVLWSIRVPWCARASQHWADLPLALLGALLAGGVALAPSLGAAITPLTLLIGGALAISAMLLPGISGSLVLLVLGLYQAVAGSVHERRFDILLWTVGGIVIGAAGFIPALRWLLRRWHDRTMALLSGLMVGSLVALWPWKAHYVPKLIPAIGAMSLRGPIGSWWWPVCAALLGMAVIALGERLAVHKDKPCPTGG